MSFQVQRAKIDCFGSEIVIHPKVVLIGMVIVGPVCDVIRSVRLSKVAGIRERVQS